MHCHCTHMHATYHGIDMLASQARLLAMKADYEAAKSMVGGVEAWLAGQGIGNSSKTQAPRGAFVGFVKVCNPPFCIDDVLA